jgi:hypothetical protein
MEHKSYDYDGDGEITKSDLNQVELENRDKKEDQQRRMAWIAMLSMLVFTGLLFTPLIDLERLRAISDLLSMFYIAQAGIVATFFGAQAYLNK